MVARGKADVDDDHADAIRRDNLQCDAFGDSAAVEAVTAVGLLCVDLFLDLALATILGC